MVQAGYAVQLLTLASSAERLSVHYALDDQVAGGIAMTPSSHSNIGGVSASQPPVQGPELAAIHATAAAASAAALLCTTHRNTVSNARRQQHVMVSIQSAPPTCTALTPLLMVSPVIFKTTFKAWLLLDQLVF